MIDINDLGFAPDNTRITFVGPPSLRLLVCGINRSGTKYVAAVLNAAGVLCGHEAVFRTNNRIDWGAGNIESSGFAIPWLGSLHRSTEIVHVVRDPLKWLVSWRKKRVTISTAQRYLSFDYHTKVAHMGIDIAALGLWVDWNMRIETHASWRFRVESIDDETVRRMCIAAGCDALPHAITEAVLTVPRNINSATDGLTSGYTIESSATNWADLPQCREVTKASELAARYGYSYDK